MMILRGLAAILGAIALSPEQHRGRAAHYYAKGMFYADRAKQAHKRGNCSESIEFLLRAARHSGRLHSEIESAEIDSEWLGVERTPQIVKDMNFLDNSIGKIEHDIRMSCSRDQ